MTLDSHDHDHAEIVGLLQPFVDGELDDDERLLVATRIAENPEYQAIVREQQQVRALLRSLPRELAPAGLRERVLADLDAVDAERRAAEQRGWFAPVVGRIKAFGRGAMLMVPAAAAAVVLFVVANNAGWIGGVEVQGTHVDGGMANSLLTVRPSKQASAQPVEPVELAEAEGLVNGADLDELGFAVQIAPSGALPPDVALVSDGPSSASSSAVVRYKVGGRVGAEVVMVDNQRRAGVVEPVGTRQVFREHAYHLGFDDQGRPRVQFQVGRVHHSLVLEGGNAHHGARHGAQHGADANVDGPEFQSLLFVADALRQAHE